MSALKKILAKIDADELVELTRELIRIPSVYRPDDPGATEAKVAAHVEGWLRREGFAVEIQTVAPGRPNVIGTLGEKRPGTRSLLLEGHTDVVTEGDPHAWSRPPFGAELVDGRIYGRGAADMKGGLAAAIVAVETLLESGLELPGALEISGTVDEESGGYGGVAYLARQGLFSKPRVDHVIIPEPLNVDRVCIGHRGVWWAEIETHGRVAHGSMPFLGDCAARHMGAVLDAFERELWPALARRRTAMPVVPAGARASTLNVNSIHGGQAEGHGGLPSPCVPDSCRMVIDRRFLIEEGLADVKGEVLDILDRLGRDRPGFHYDVRDLMEVHPVLADRGLPVPQAVGAAIHAVLGREAQFVCSPGTYDQKHIARIGHLHDCVAYGPGILDLAHQPDEFVAIGDLVASAKVMAVATLQLLGLGR